jgi:hypothetical protein
MIAINMIPDVGDDPTLHPRIEPEVGLSVVFTPTVVQTHSDRILGIKLHSDSGDVGYIRLWHYDSIIERLESESQAAGVKGVITSVVPFVWRRTMCFHGRVDCYQEVV